MFHGEQTHEEGDLEGEKYQQPKTGWFVFWELRMLCYVGFPVDIELEGCGKRRFRYDDPYGSSLFIHYIGLRCKDGFGYASLRATSMSSLQPDGNNNSRVGALQEIKYGIQWVHYIPSQLCNLYISAPLAGIFGDFAET
jgi:hypothetical protein